MLCFVFGIYLVNSILSPLSHDKWRWILCIFYFLSLQVIKTYLWQDIRSFNFRTSFNLINYFFLHINFNKWLLFNYSLSIELGCIRNHFNIIQEMIHAACIFYKISRRWSPSITYLCFFPHFSYFYQTFR